jgi:hypothetical protein
MKPTERQILGAKVRAEAEKYEAKNRKKVREGWELPAGYWKKRDAHLAQKFNLDPREASRFLTWSRSCTHSWSEGACHLCP